MISSIDRSTSIRVLLLPNQQIYDLAAFRLVFWAHVPHPHLDFRNIAKSCYLENVHSKLESEEIY